MHSEIKTLYMHESRPSKIHDLTNTLFSSYLMQQVQYEQVCAATDRTVWDFMLQHGQDTKVDVIHVTHLGVNPRFAQCLKEEEELRKGGLLVEVMQDEEIRKNSQCPIFCLR